MIDVHGVEIKVGDWISISCLQKKGWVTHEFVSLAKVTEAFPGGIQILRYTMSGGNLTPHPRKQRKSKSECVMVLNKELFERLQ